MPPEALTIAYLADPNSVHTRKWIGYFAGRGHRVWLLIARGATVEPGLDPRIELREFVPFTSRRFRPLGMLAARRSLRGVLRTIAPDLLHAHYLTVHGWHAWLAGSHPYVMTVWGSDVYLAARQSPQARLMARLVLGAADLVTADSRDLAAAAIGQGARAQRTRVVPFGVDTETFAPGPMPEQLRKQLHLEKRRVLLAPRIIAPVYRTLSLLQALDHLPDDVVVVMSRLRAWPGYLDLVERWIEGHNLRDRTRLVDHIPPEEMIDFYRLADVVVSVPASDGTPVTLLEAMSTGRPVVATDLPSVREWLGDIRPQSLVPVDDPQETARAIATELAAPVDAREELGRVFRDRIVERADYVRCMADIEEAYRVLVVSDRATGARRPSAASRPGSPND